MLLLKLYYTLRYNLPPIWQIAAPSLASQGLIIHWPWVVMWPHPAIWLGSPSFQFEYKPSSSPSHVKLRPWKCNYTFKCCLSKLQRKILCVNVIKETSDKSWLNEGNLHSISSTAICWSQNKVDESIQTLSHYHFISIDRFETKLQNI